MPADLKSIFHKWNIDEMILPNSLDEVKWKIHMLLKQNNLKNNQKKSKNTKKNNEKKVYCV